MASIDSYINAIIPYALILMAIFIFRHPIFEFFGWIRDIISPYFEKGKEKKEELFQKIPKEITYE